MAKSSSLASKVSGSFLMSRLVFRSSALDGSLSFSSMAFNRLVAEGFNLSVPCRIPDYNHASSPSPDRLDTRTTTVDRELCSPAETHPLSLHKFSEPRAIRLRQAVANETGSDCATKRAGCGAIQGIAPSKCADRAQLGDCSRQIGQRGTYPQAGSQVQAGK